MRVLIILLFLFCALAAQASTRQWNSVNVLQYGTPASSLSKDLIFNVGDGVTNPTLSVDTVNKDFDFSKSVNVTGDLKTTANLTQGAGSNTTLCHIVDIGAGVANPQKCWDSVLNAWTFSTDGVNFLRLGSGSGGGAGINILENPGFEQGISVGWTCSGATCTEETVNFLEGEKSLVFTPTIQNDEFKSVLKVIPVGLRGNSCKVSIRYIGGDENLRLEIQDGNSAVLADTQLKSHETATLEELQFICPSQSDIDGDALKGQLSLRVYNQTATPAASGTFDQMKLGDNDGVFETTLPDVLGARVSNNGSASLISQKGDFIQAVNRDALGDVSVTFKPGVFTVLPSVTLTANTGNSINLSVTNLTVSGFTAVSRVSTTAGGADHDFEMTVVKQGADAKQSVQVAKAAPTLAQTENSFSAFVTAGNVVSQESPIIWISSINQIGIDANGRTLELNWAPSLNLTDKMNCTGILSGPNGVTNNGLKLIYNQSSSDSSKGVFLIPAFSGTQQDFTVFCDKGEVDYVSPIVQTVIVNQVSTPIKSGIEIVGCTVDGVGIEIGTGCSSWLTSISPDGTGLKNWTLNTSFQGKPLLDCSCSPHRDVAGFTDADKLCTWGFETGGGDFSNPSVLRTLTEDNSTLAGQDFPVSFSCRFRR